MLDAAWLQEQEEVENRQREGMTSARYETPNADAVPGLYFQGQGIYGKPHKIGSRFSAPAFYLHGRERERARHNQGEVTP